ncbi:MAG: FRG domain-containing protein [Lachnospiraceae bacterium]|nr:FRG domain-containing protein [Lachnospiraceae bacterium]
MRQAGFRHFYRGENQIYKNTESTLCRKIREYKTYEEQELYRLISDMRIAEFRYLLGQFLHVQEWNLSDILYECIAQHYGMETSWLDITSSYDVALFFATCFYKDNKWYPLTKNETEQSEEKRYGLLFHMPSCISKTRWLRDAQEFQNLSAVEVDNLIYPIGFQPFILDSRQIITRNPHKASAAQHQVTHTGLAAF